MEDIERTHIKFIFALQKPKTQVWTIMNKYENGLLGEIRWYPGWRKYSFFPLMGTLYEEVCLREISDFIEKLTKEHKRKCK